ncbi:MAG: aminotransferase class I/II-fold pyridoxal phosphate-dependent enzyme [Flavobacteriales bacterium]|nr:aminotransferase class I/II-fold pyridoxal phosphate-dependent enzyme [Flavobacteriales bacterium]
MAQGLVGSEIIKLAGEVKKKIAAGEHIYNFTIGDFNPSIFPIPSKLKDAIIQAYNDGHTNYPMANGMAELRKSVSGYLKTFGDLDYGADDILVSAGSRPLIYATYRALIDPDDTVLYPVPSWNNNHYTHLTSAKSIFVETTPEHNFMPSAEDLAPYISEANLVAVCSPLNPTGTVFTEEALSGICELILEENKRREGVRKPVYLMYDSVYWMILNGETKHFNPVHLYPEMREYTVSIDGISKAFCATGVRVGWAFGPTELIGRMKAILSHMGAWSPKAEQLAVGSYLSNNEVVKNDIDAFRTEVSYRLNGFYEGFTQMKNDGLPVDVIDPQGAIYLTIKFDLIGKNRADGSTIDSIEDTTSYLLNEAKVALVPFYCFGAPRTSKWYRLSIGTASREDVRKALGNIETALNKLS